MMVGPEIAIVLVIIVLLFGGRKIPEIARGLGTAQREFRLGLREGQHDPAPVDHPVDQPGGDARVDHAGPVPPPTS